MNQKFETLVLAGRQMNLQQLSHHLEQAMRTPGVAEMLAFTVRQMREKKCIEVSKPANAEKLQHCSGYMACILDLERFLSNPLNEVVEEKDARIQTVD